MTGNEYQKLAARTINPNLNARGKRNHALHGLAGEVGEIHSIYQKEYQGHNFDPDHEMKELGDLMWFIAELCTAQGYSMDDILEMNISKLRDRYPDGFEKGKSLHRADGDI